MAGIGIILNRNAKKGQSFRGRIGEKLGFILGDPQSLRETFEVSEIGAVARLFQEREIDILGIGGGDGSGTPPLGGGGISDERHLPPVPGGRRRGMDRPASERTGGGRVRRIPGREGLYLPQRGGRPLGRRNPQGPIRE